MFCPDITIAVGWTKSQESFIYFSEATYAFQEDKPIIPLKIEKDFQPKGWLGFLRGDKKWFDFSGKYPFEDKFEELVKDLGSKGKK